MRKITGILLAVALLVLSACAALADEFPQPEGGKKFESDWAVAGGLAQIFYEEEGYRVLIRIDSPDGASCSEWEYSCYYNEGKDALLSVSSFRTDYTINPDNGEKSLEDYVYEGFDDIGHTTEFTVDENGCLIWKNGRDGAGADLKFTDIGRFDGVWKNEQEETEVEFMWNGTDEDSLFYTVYIQRGNPGAEHYALFLMNGFYDPAEGRLSAAGTCTLFTKNASGEYDTEDDGESYDAFFSMTEDGKLLYETANGIELEYDIMGHQP